MPYGRAPETSRLVSPAYSPCYCQVMSGLRRTASAAQAFMYRRGLIRKMGKMQQVLLTTVGRKSGKPRTVQLGAVPERDGWVVIGSARGADAHPNWWLYMVANPNLTVHVDDNVIKARMQEITNPAEYEGAGS